MWPPTSRASLLSISGDWHAPANNAALVSYAFSVKLDKELTVALNAEGSAATKAYIRHLNAETVAAAAAAKAARSSPAAAKAARSSPAASSAPVTSTRDMNAEVHAEPDLALLLSAIKRMEAAKAGQVSRWVYQDDMAYEDIQALCRLVCTGSKLQSKTPPKEAEGGSGAGSSKGKSPKSAEGRGPSAPFAAQTSRPARPSRVAIARHAGSST